MNTTETFKHKIEKTAKEDSLPSQLFDFARTADHINAALRNLSCDNLTDDDRSLIAASDELRPYLSIMARKAERVASCLRVVAEQKEKIPA